MRKLKTINLTILIFISLLFYVASALGQQGIPPKPKNQTAVFDQDSIFTPYEARALEQKLLNYADSTSTQIVVATIATVNGENIALYAAKWAHDWGIGQADKDNGVFVLIAKDDRKLTIQTGYGVEHLLTDNLSKRIITNIITPEFKRGNFYAGIDRGTSAIIQILNGEYQETRDFNNEREEVPIFIIILFFIILLIVLSNIKRGGGRRGRRFRNNDTARSILEAIILSRSGRGGFGGGGFGGSSGGGSFGGGFGGGGFGGGGASGGW